MSSSNFFICLFTFVTGSKIKVRSLTRHGKTVIYEPEGFLARIFQHEIDHLYGHLFIEKATDLQKVGD